MIVNGQHKCKQTVASFKSGSCTCVLQSSSYGESISTLGFGSRVSEITLGQAKKNSESAQIYEAKDQLLRYDEAVPDLLPCITLQMLTMSLWSIKGKLLKPRPSLTISSLWPTLRAGCA